MTTPLDRAKQQMEVNVTGRSLTVNPYAGPMTYANLQWLIDRNEKLEGALQLAKDWLISTGADGSPLPTINEALKET